MNQMKTRMFSFYIFVDVYKKTRTFAIKERRSISSVINQALIEFMKGK